MSFRWFKLVSLTYEKTKIENFEQILLTVNMKIIHEKNIKGCTKKGNGKWKTFIVKEKKFPSAPKIL